MLLHRWLAVVVMAMFIPAQLLDLIIVDLREDYLFLQTKAVVAAAVETSAEMPRKSRTRGRAMLNSLSRNSPMRFAAEKYDADLHALAGQSLRRTSLRRW